MGSVTAGGAMDMGIEIAWMTGAAVAGAASGIAPVVATDLQGAVSGDVGVTVGAESIVDHGARDDVAGVADDAGGSGGDAVMVFTLMAELEICGVGAVATAAVDRGADDMRRGVAPTVGAGNQGAVAG